MKGAEFRSKLGISIFKLYRSYSNLYVDDYTWKLPMIHSLYGWFTTFITSTNDEGEVITGICVSICLSFSNIMEKYVCEFWLNFIDWSEMSHETDF